MRKLSELEGVSLGLVRKHQPCTAYRVRCALKEAPSSHWRASAGSLYPLLNRLEDEGLIASTSDAGDGRGRSLLRITAAGRRRLRNWILSGVERKLIASVTDPVRSRTFFLDSLDEKQQVQLVEELIAQLETYLAETETHLANIAGGEDRFGYLGALGAVTVTKARLDWLRTVREHLPDK